MAHNNETQELQNFLDTNQYSKLSISRYEVIFGRTFVSTGGVNTTKDLAKKLNLKAGQKVLDVGCGLGGSAFYLAKNFGVSVLGIDLSRNMISRANEYLREQDDSIQKLVSFEVNDILTINLPENFVDAVYSRDAILHIDSKESLFQRLFKWVKPGGELLITDYCRGRPQCTAEFESYVAQRGYRLVTVPQYGELLQDAGWTSVQSINNSPEFTKVMNMELKKLEAVKDQFITEFSQEDYDELEHGWNKKLRWISQNDHAWGLFIAKKPSA